MDSYADLRGQDKYKRDGAMGSAVPTGVRKEENPGKTSRFA